MELHIHQISLKQQVSQGIYTVQIKSGETSQQLQLNLGPTQRQIRYINPLKIDLSETTSKFVHFQVQSEDKQQQRLLGTKKLNILEWNEQRHERNIDIELEDSNQISIKCFTQKAQEKKQDTNRVRQSQMQVESQKWSKTLRDTSATKKPIATPTSRKSPNSRMFTTASRLSKPNTEDTKDLSQLNQSNNLNISQQMNQSKQQKNSDDDLEFEKRDSILSPRVCTPIPTQMTDNQSSSRVPTDDRSHHDKSHLKGLSDSAYTEDIPQELANQLQNRLSTLEILFSQQLQNRTSLANTMSVNNMMRTQVTQLQDFELQDLRQMLKELALVLDVKQDCNTIVQAVSRLVNKNRLQSEQIIKLQCDNQVLQQHLQNLTIQQTLMSDKQKDLQKSIKQKLKIYQTLFEENVELKNVLKQDMQKIMNLHLELKQYKNDEKDRGELDNSIKFVQFFINSSLNQNIQTVTVEVEERRKRNQVLQEEIQLLQQIVDDSIQT